jgi:GDP-4-dehydro-6-deoxy-D-mannose reductase
LSNILAERDDVSELVGTRLSTSRGSLQPVHKRVRLVECDIRDSSQVEKVVSDSAPDVIFHCAAFVSVKRSFENPSLTFETNVIGTINLLEAVRRASVDAKVMVPGSAEEYGKVEPSLMPIKESTPLAAKNPYGLSKIAQEKQSQYYFETQGMKVFLSRSFHYTGPGQPTGFVCSDFAKQVAEMEKNSKAPVISVGNLKAKRDFTDIRDVCRAYVHIVDEGRPGQAYNVCSGKSVAMSEVLETLVGMSSKKVKVEVDQSKMRPSDVPDFVGDNSKLRKETKWSPTIPIKESLRDVLDFWRSRV